MTRNASLNRLIHHAPPVLLELMIQEEGAEIHVGDLPEIAADGAQMTQVFQNLVANALKYRAKERPPRVKITSSVAGEGYADKTIRIFVEDNGIGIEEKYWHRIFAPFQRLHGRGEYEGIGMGLVICSKIIKKHGGHIRVESTPEEGSVFIRLRQDTLQLAAGMNGEATRRSLVRRRVGFCEFRLDTP